MGRSVRVGGYSGMGVRVLDVKWVGWEDGI